MAVLLVAAPCCLTTSPSALQAQRVDDPRIPQDSVGAADPSEVFLKAFTSVQQGEKLEEDGKLRPALAKYRFAASLLEQLNQTNPNWQPLIVRYRIRKTTDNIRKLEEKVSLQPPTEAAAPGTHPAGASPGAPAAEDDDLPVADAPSSAERPSLAPVSSAEPVQMLSVATSKLEAKFNKSQQDLKAANEALATAKKERQEALKQLQDLEFQSHSLQSSTSIVNRRLDRIKADRDDLQKQLDQAQVRLTEAHSKNPEAVAETRKELRDQITTLKKGLAKAEADTTAAQKERDAVNAKLADSESRTAKLAEERDHAVALNETTKDAAEKVQALQTENAELTKKLSDAESSIAQLTSEAVKKKEELTGMEKELTAVKDQLATTRDQQDRSETTITELRQKLDDDTKQLADLKSKGMSGEDFARMTNENTLLKGIVMRQLKVEASRSLARKLVSDELARLEVQSNVLNEQIEQLGRPNTPLSDEERQLFKDPQVSISDTGDPASFAATITAVKPKSGDAATTPANGSPAPDAPPASADPAAASGVVADASPSGDSAPQVETNYKPKVSEELQPLAIQAKESFDRGHYTEAEETYRKLLARDPKNPYLLSNQGVVLFRQNKLKSAEVVLKKAIAANPKDAFSLATLGIVYYRMHSFDAAITALTQAIQLDPKNATAHNYLGITSSQKGWPEAALEEVSKAIALNPKYADAHFNIAVIYATNQPPAKDQAEEHYKIATSLGAAPDPALEKLIGKK